MWTEWIPGRGINEFEVPVKVRDNLPTADNRIVDAEIDAPFAHTEESIFETNTPTKPIPDVTNVVKKMTEKGKRQLLNTF